MTKILTQKTGQLSEQELKLKTILNKSEVHCGIVLQTKTKLQDQKRFQDWRKVNIKKIKEVLKTELENIDENGSLILESIELFNDKDFIPLLGKKIIENKKSKKVNEDWLLETIDKFNGK